eukprot:jgi/Tetstr1/432951/TSEL_022289.t1
MGRRAASDKSEGAGGGRALPPGGLSPSLPLLPLYEAVLLPLGFVRVSVPDSAVGEVELVQRLAAAFLRDKQRSQRRSGGSHPSAAPSPPLVAAVPVVSARSMGVLEPVSGQWAPDDARPTPPELASPGGAAQPPAESGALVEAGGGTEAEDRMLFPVGTVAVVLQVRRVQTDDGGEVHWDMVLEGVCRVGVEGVERERGALYYSAAVRQLDGFEAGDARLAAAGGEPPGALVEQLRDVSGRLVRGLRSALLAQGESSTPGGSASSSSSIMGATERLRSLLETLPPARAADVLASALADPGGRLAVLSAVEPKQRIELSIALANGALASLQRAGRVSVRSSAGRAGGVLAGRKPAAGADEGVVPEDDIKALRARLEGAGLPAEVLEVGMKEVVKLERMGEQHPGAASVRSYVELLADLPWSKRAAELLREDGTHVHQPPSSLESVKRALDAGHEGLSKVKQRILEYVAVGRLVGNEAVPGPILCFIGPPGVGKTSLADAIAAVLGRPLARLALGGVRDEAEIRGHRRTYIGAMPGRVIQGLRRAGCRDPVMLLDEVDKVGNDARGDPMSALLEVLDPSQNHTYTDTYLGLPFDLSKVVFVATANEEGAIPGPLRDRMEIIRIGGYTLEERVRIAAQHLVPRVLAGHGLSAGAVQFPTSTLSSLALHYTREAGVRDLNRKLEAVCRHVALQTALLAEAPVPEAPPPDARPASEATDSAQSTRAVAVDEALLSEVLGPPRFTGHEAEERITGPGSAAGLVWTPVGGALQFVEAAAVSPPNFATGDSVGAEPTRREGRLTLTGQLGDVLGESAQIALSWLRANAARLGLPARSASGAPCVFTSDVHVHFPAGAIPKDGPSAGVTLAAALLSLFSGRPLRGDVAMTGELSLRGLVLPVGGVKEKVLAAAQAGMATVLLPARNLPDIQSDMPPALADGRLQVVGCATMEDVLGAAFEGGFPLAPLARL